MIKQKTMTKKNVLATIEDPSFAVARKKINIFNQAISQPPPAKWIKKHNGVNYLPIDKVEYLLTRFFLKWWPEVRQVQVIANSVVVTLRLYYLHPVDNNMSYADGVGAAPIHTESGASPGDMMKIQAYSVQKAAPSAKAFALKNAAFSIGRIFGTDIARKNTLSEYDLLDDTERFKDLIE